MRKLLNTLHVMTQGAYLHRDGETIAIKVGQELKLRIPIHTLEGLVCWGQVACSPQLLGLCCERGVGISFLTEQGKFLARVTGPVSGNVLLRRQQYRMADGADGALPTVRTIVAAKIGWQGRLFFVRRALRYAARSGPRISRGRLPSQVGSPAFTQARTVFLCVPNRRATSSTE